VEAKKLFDWFSFRRSIFIGIKRAVLCQDFAAALATKRVVHVQYNFLNGTEKMEGTVSKIVSYLDGILVYLLPTPVSDLKWPIIPIWIPKQGSCGVLTTWVSNSERVKGYE
jgi:hypothetical protein